MQRDGQIPLQVPNKSYLTLFNFKLNKYQNDKVIKHLEGKNAALTAVNLIEFTDRVRGWRYSKNNPKQKDELEAAFVRAHLDSRSLEDFQRPVKVTDAFFGGGVSLRHEDLAISTQEAHYLGSEKNILTGNKPVHAVRATQFVESESGFRIHLNDDSMELLGKVRGVINPNDAK